jgi:hypothetical protein
MLAIVDNNGNGMSDVWERKFQVVGVDPTADLDADNQNNLAESLAGTDPNDGQSLLEISQIENRSSALFLSWQSLAGLKYQIMSSDSLVSASWQAAGEEIVGNGVRMVSAFDISSQSSKFYRVEIVDDHSALVRSALQNMTHDTDGDGQSDVNEISAGLNPFDSASRNQPPRVEFGQGVSFTWSSLPGKRYQLRSRPIGTNTMWVYEADFFIGTGADITATIVNENITGQEYSVECSDIDSDDDNLTDWEELEVGLNPQMSKTDILGPLDSVILDAQLAATNVICVKASGAIANISRMKDGGFEIIREGGVDAVAVQFTITGTAVGGGDYVALPSTVTIPFGQDSIVVLVTPLAASTMALTQSVILTIQDTPAYDLGAQHSQQVNIIKEVALNVNDFGAVGDGVVDDTTSVQAALDALGASLTHNSLYFPSGVYRLDTTVLDNHYGVYKERILTFGQHDQAGRDIVITANGDVSLYSTASPVRSDILVVRGTFRTLQFYGMKWEKDSDPLARLVNSEPNGADGVSLVRYDNRYLESLDFYECDFINCHGAIKTYLSGYADQGKMKHVGFYDCNILNPYGANTIDSSAAWGGGQQCNLNSWVGEAVYLRNTFDGGGEDLTDQSTSPGGHLKDGSHFGSPGHLIFKYNTVLRMGVEAVFQQSINNGLGTTTASFLMPPVDGVTSSFIQISGEIDNFFIGQNVNIRTPATPVLTGGSNLFEIVGLNTVNKSISLKNIGYETNVPAGTTIISNLGIFLQDNKGTTALISDNFIDGTLPPGGVAFDSQSGIVATSRAVIENNVIRNFWTGINLYDEVKRPLFPSNRGAVVSNNFIESRDTRVFAGSFALGIQMHGGDEVVMGNYIITPNSSMFLGIIARGDNSLIYKNYVGANTTTLAGRYSQNRSVGVATARTSGGGVKMIGNVTRGFDVGAGRAQYYQDVNYTISDFMSFGDKIATDPQFIWDN